MLLFTCTYAGNPPWQAKVQYRSGALQECHLSQAVMKTRGAEGWKQPWQLLWQRWRQQHGRLADSVTCVVMTCLSCSKEEAKMTPVPDIVLWPVCGILFASGQPILLNQLMLPCSALNQTLTTLVQQTVCQVEDQSCTTMYAALPPCMSP